MPALDDSDPISVLNRKINQILDGEDGHTALAALAWSLCASLELAASKQPWGEAPAISIMRGNLRGLVAAMITARDMQRCES